MEDKMSKISIKFAHTDSVLFSYECEDNDIRKTLDAAIAQGAELSGARFDGCDLSNMDLSHGWLAGAQFKDCDLSNTKFDHAYMEGALFENSNLDQASFNNVYIKDAMIYQYDLINSTYNSF
jgi:uncharacterized protein YjbI with pentapeptide repeats